MLCVIRSLCPTLTVISEMLCSQKAVGLRIQDVIEHSIRWLNVSITSVSIVLAVTPSDYTTS